MPKPKFFSWEVNVRRLSKAILLLVVFPVTLFILGAQLSIKVGDLFSREEERNKCYQSNILGTESPTLIGEYGDLRRIADEFVWEWDWKREGSRRINKFISYPEYYHDSYIADINDSWMLKGGYELDIMCEEVNLKVVAPFDPYPCTIYYNDKEITDTLSQVSHCEDFENYSNCSGVVRFTVYSSRYDGIDEPEYLVTGTWASGSKEDISIFTLKDGNFEKLSFSGRKGLSKTVFISYEGYELYINDEGDIELVTYFQEPSMGSDNNVQGIYEVWELKNGIFYLRETIVDLHNDIETVENK
jgi:hypothetical protein